MKIQLELEYIPGEGSQAGRFALRDVASGRLIFEDFEHHLTPAQKEVVGQVIAKQGMEIDALLKRLRQ